jgi:hypothetical protein
MLKMAEAKRNVRQEVPYWFPAKRYGWGWGPPATWHGWVVLIVWFLALAAAAFTFLPTRPVAFQLAVAGLALALVLVCYAKGEPPSWRWGDRK